MSVHKLPQYSCCQDYCKTSSHPHCPAIPTGSAMEIWGFGNGRTDHGEWEPLTMVGACFFVLIIASISNIPSVENRHFVHMSRVNSEEFFAHRPWAVVA